VILRLLGSVLVIFACTVLGLYYSMRDSFRITDLTELKKALVLLKGEIEFTLTPLPEAAATVAGRLKPAIARFFELFSFNLSNDSGLTAASAWCEAVKDGLSRLHLNEEDLRNVERLGETLGYLSKQTQLEGLEMAVLYLDDQIGRLRGSETQNKRLYRNVGLILGALIVIILI